MWAVIITDAGRYSANLANLEKKVFYLISIVIFINHLNY